MSESSFPCYKKAPFMCKLQNMFPCRKARFHSMQKACFRPKFGSYRNPSTHKLVDIFVSAVFRFSNRNEFVSTVKWEVMSSKLSWLFPPLPFCLILNYVLAWSPMRVSKRLSIWWVWSLHFNCVSVATFSFISLHCIKLFHCILVLFLLLHSHVLHPISCLSMYLNS